MFGFDQKLASNNVMELVNVGNCPPNNSIPTATTMVTNLNAEFPVQVAPGDTGAIHDHRHNRAGAGGEPAYVSFMPLGAR